MSDLAQSREDFRLECEELDRYVAGLPNSAWDLTTPFFDWSVRDQILHLFQVDRFGVTALLDRKAFIRQVEKVRILQAQGIPLSEQIRREFTGASHAQVLEAWRNGYRGVVDAAGSAEPGLRIAWFGPDMGLKSFLSARQMEVWAHGQDVFDLMLEPRPVHDRIRNVCELGVRTLGWSFKLRERPVPPAPRVTLTAPSGAAFEWLGDENGSVTGSALEFALVVTQRRAVEDTQLATQGAAAAEWMRIAQCFAGAPQERAAPGARPPA